MRWLIEKAVFGFITLLAVAVPEGVSDSRKDLERRWADLRSLDGGKAYRAMGQLENAGDQAVRFMEERLSPVVGIPRQWIALLIEELDSKQFTVRDRAQHELEKLQDLAEEELVKALTREPPLETRRRIDRLLDKMDLLKSPKRLRAVRAIEVLEGLATAEARRVLQRLAGGAPEALLTREAKASLNRLAKKATPGSLKGK